MCLVIYTDDFNEPIAVGTERWLPQRDFLEVVWEAFYEIDRDYPCLGLFAAHSEGLSAAAVGQPA